MNRMKREFALWFLRRVVLPRVINRVRAAIIELRERIIEFIRAVERAVLQMVDMIGNLLRGQEEPRTETQTS